MSRLGEDLGAFSISETPSRKVHISPQFPLTGDFAWSLKDISDEQVVNKALLVYLDAIAIHCPLVKADWTLERRAFIVKDRGEVRGRRTGRSVISV